MTTTDFYADAENTSAMFLTIQNKVNEMVVSELGKHIVFKAYSWNNLLSVFVLCVASFVGTTGNVLTLLAIATCKKIRNEESIFLANLAVADMYVTVVADPMSIVGKFMLFLQHT